MKEKGALGRYPESIRNEAVAAVEKRRLRNPRDRTVYREVAEQLGVGEQSLRLWVRKHDEKRRGTAPTSNGVAPQEPHADEGLKSTEFLKAELAAMQRKIDKLKQENELLKRAFVVFSSEWSK